MTAADLVIRDLADTERDLRVANRQLVDLVADLAYENVQLRIIAERELGDRLHGDIRIALLTRRGQSEGA
jgi:hypothetical protein